MCKKNIHTKFRLVTRNGFSYCTYCTKFREFELFSQSYVAGSLYCAYSLRGQRGEASATESTVVGSPESRSSVAEDLDERILGRARAMIEGDDSDLALEVGDHGERANLTMEFHW